MLSFRGQREMLALRRGLRGRPRACHWSLAPRKGQNLSPPCCPLRFSDIFTNLMERSSFQRKWRESVHVSTNLGFLGPKLKAASSQGQGNSVCCLPLSYIRRRSSAAFADNKKSWRSQAWLVRQDLFQGSERLRNCKERGPDD